ncbi:hypothetical protein GCM10020256_09550 [Streptomyces thermocoprophilus]
MGESLVQHRAGPRVAERAEALHAGESHPPVRVVRAQPTPQRGDQGGHGLGCAQLCEEPYRVQGVGDAQLVGGEGGGGPCGARVAEPGEGVGGGDTALGVAVVEQQDEGLEGATVPGQAQPERGQFPRPQRAARLGEHGGQLVEVRGGGQPVELGRAGRLVP